MVMVTKVYGELVGPIQNNKNLLGPMFFMVLSITKNDKSFF
jgi:hypothetical protein